MEVVAREVKIRRGKKGVRCRSEKREIRDGREEGRAGYALIVLVVTTTKFPRCSIKKMIMNGGDLHLVPLWGTHPIQPLYPSASCSGHSPTSSHKHIRAKPDFVFTYRSRAHLPSCLPLLFCPSSLSRPTGTFDI